MFPELLIDLVLPRQGTQDGTEDSTQEATSRPEADWPVIAWLHGGGWRMHDRLAPTWNHPAQVNDLRQAVRWLKVNVDRLGLDADRLGLDADRIGLWGYSVGGRIAAVAALSSHVDLLPGESIPEEFSHMSTAVTCVVEGYGPPLLNCPAPPPFFVLHGTGGTSIPVSDAETPHNHLVDLGDWHLTTMARFSGTTGEFPLPRVALPGDSQNPFLTTRRATPSSTSSPAPRSTRWATCSAVSSRRSSA